MHLLYLRNYLLSVTSKLILIRTNTHTHRYAHTQVRTHTGTHTQIHIRTHRHGVLVVTSFKVSLLLVSETQIIVSHANTLNQHTHAHTHTHACMHTFTHTRGVLVVTVVLEFPCFWCQKHKSYFFNIKCKPTHTQQQEEWHVLTYDSRAAHTQQ